MYIHEAPSVTKPKSSNKLFERPIFEKLVRKQYGNPDSHAFLVILGKTNAYLFIFIFYDIAFKTFRHPEIDAHFRKLVSR